MDFKKKIPKEGMCIISLEEHEYIQQFGSIIKSINPSDDRICCICLTKPYNDVLKELEKAGVDEENFFFIDILTSHYKLPDPKHQCMFINAPFDIHTLEKGIEWAVQEKGCTKLFIDSVLSLLQFFPKHNIIQFTNTLRNEFFGDKNTISQFILLAVQDDSSEEDKVGLVKDMGMFVDSFIEFKK